MSIVYHGGTEIIENPKVDVGRSGLDFGKGFYVTARKEQAENWARRASRQRRAEPVLTVYEYDEQKASSFRGLIFKEYDVNWLQFIVSCRGGYNPADVYDYVEGGVANDRVIDTVEGYINGTIDAEHALVELSKHQPNHQICFLSAGIIRECLIYKEAIKIDVE